MNDFDVLVHREKVMAAIRLLDQWGWVSRSPVLTRQGWRIKTKPASAFTEVDFSTGHGANFTNAKGYQLDLHWHLLEGYNTVDTDDIFWRDAITIEFYGTQTCALNPTDQVFHVCVHGAKWAPLPPLRWAADAVMVINSSQKEIDWGRMIAQARRRRVVLPIKKTLNYLHHDLNAPVPYPILKEIENIPISKFQRFEHLIRTRPPNPVQDRFSEAYLLSKSYLNLRKRDHEFSGISGVLKFLRYYCGVENTGRFLLYNIREVMRKMGLVAKE